MRHRLAGWCTSASLAVVLVAGCRRADPTMVGSRPVPSTNEPNASARERVDDRTVHRFVVALGDRMEQELLAWAEVEFPDRRSEVLALLVFDPESPQAKARVIEVIDELGIDSGELRTFVEQHPLSDAEIAAVTARVDASLAVESVKRRLDALDMDDGFPNTYFGDAVRDNMVAAGATALLAQMPRPRLPKMFQDWEEVVDRRSLEALVELPDNSDRPVLVYVRIEGEPESSQVDSLLQHSQVVDHLPRFLRVVIDVTEATDPIELLLHTLFKSSSPHLFVYRSGRDLVGDVRSSDPGDAAWYFRWQGTGEELDVDRLVRALAAID
ncbi:MAG: hypothetical protein K0V04_14395 [Deltaproteobacteria bacterium]|nr:hypothetical protein [Deltaproteobacteria bacterium]